MGSSNRDFEFFSLFLAAKLSRIFRWFAYIALLIIVLLNSFIHYEYKINWFIRISILYNYSKKHYTYIKLYHIYQEGEILNPPEIRSIDDRYFDEIPSLKKTLCFNFVLLLNLYIKWQSRQLPVRRRRRSRRQQSLARRPSALALARSHSASTSTRCSSKSTLVSFDGRRVVTDWGR